MSWIRRLFDDNFHPWKRFAEHFLRLIGAKHIFHENLKIAKSIDGLVKKLPEFYRNVISIWAQNSHIFISSETNCPTDVLNQQLFNNKFVSKKIMHFLTTISISEACVKLVIYTVMTIN